MNVTGYLADGRTDALAAFRAANRTRFWMLRGYAVVVLLLGAALAASADGAAAIGYELMLLSPVVALLPEITMRKVAARLPDFVQEPGTLTLTDESLTIWRPSVTVEYRWAAIRSAALVGDRWVLRLGRHARLSWPRSVFTPEQEAQVVAFLQARLGTPVPSGR
jgi:hypothetical protein